MSTSFPFQRFDFYSYRNRHFYENNLNFSNVLARPLKSFFLSRWALNTVTNLVMSTCRKQAPKKIGRLFAVPWFVRHYLLCSGMWTKKLL